MAKKLMSLISVILMIASANSADIVCNWSGETCNLNSGTAITQPNEVITISGKAANYINTVTTFLMFNERFLVRTIPVNIFPIFPNLKWIQFSACRFASLAANFTASCPFLETVTIDDGYLQEVPEGFLQTCSNVKMLGLRNHEITSVHKNAFRGLGKLETLEMTRNKITCLHADLFLHTPMLLRAFFTYNKINALDRNLLRSLSQIAFFDVKYNSLTYLPAFNLTAPATYSMAFYAYGNPIVAINPSFCNIFVNRQNYFWVKNLPCLPQDSLFYVINSQNCQASASFLQTCYANWLPTMPDYVECVPGSGVCVPSNIWSKFSAFIDYLPV